MAFYQQGGAGELDLELVGVGVATTAAHQASRRRRDDHGFTLWDDDNEDDGGRGRGGGEEEELCPRSPWVVRAAGALV
eukprot:COSAG01_NODE_52548_length_346_cov_0.550607_1_plen_77_part_01